MKRTVSIIISMMCVATVLLFTSCHSNSNGSDENNVTEQVQTDDPNQIIGTWKAIKDCRRYYSNEEMAYEDCEDIKDDEELSILKFRSDGTYVFGSILDEGETGNWSVEEKGIIMSVQGVPQRVSPNSVVSIIDDRTIEVHWIILENSTPETREGLDGIWTLTFERM